MSQIDSSKRRDPFLDGAAHFPGLSEQPDCSDRSAAIIGGAMSGLAAAHALHTLGYDVDLYERQLYADKRVNCGEAMTAGSMIPLEKSTENGFLNGETTFNIQIYTSTRAERHLAGEGSFPTAEGYVTDRNVVERQWAEQLSREGVAITTGQSVTKSEYLSLAAEHDLLVDATGQPSITSKVTGRTHEYAGHMTALNADVKGDFSQLYPDSYIVFENYLGYVWAFPKTPQRANVGIGWGQRDLPDDYMSAFHAACERNGFPTPTREQTNIAIIPQGPSLNPSRLFLPEYNTVRVGDAAGIANRFSGKGISQAVHSSYLMVKLAAEDRLNEYPTQLHRLMRGEYLLAHVVRELLESGDVSLLGSVLDAVSGIDVEAADRGPRIVLDRLIEHPLLCARLICRPATLRRIYDTYTDHWEYTTIES
ncbi:MULTISPECIES: NAD(P)/FAD-dependent oxidoreductase [unclassified Haloferax]|uniref:NAD(P)/FAD-dependent oxidoreductase n=1 Tax=unclassified Haloferax TaxID=2625095 RepID=UPI002874B34D|nr:MULTISPECIES: NAD(P)/FAD-dependent oxidoreductase [unclassified Haloferax]MDS0243862.1 NAD(P)/FAD-dependent oxidoreductase [Haloferax sp. S2CR25]MDS0446983.1 NAD(P)/FAD-dependent oxidoreductase [Haloferax sp. S2CR25-2]